MEKMSKSRPFSPSSYSRNTEEVNNELRFQLELNPQFLTIGVIDTKGVVTYVVSQEPIVEGQLGKNLSQKKDYFMGVMKTGRSFISAPKVGDASKITQIVISVPIIQNGKTSSVLCGFISLSQLTKDMNMASVFDKYSILTDLDGTILTGTIPEKGKLVNLQNREPLYEKLLSSSRRVLMVDDYNYQDEKEPAMGEKISITGNKDILLFSFLKKYIQ